jgi:subtilase family serine protease
MKLRYRVRSAVLTAAVVAAVAPGVAATAQAAQAAQQPRATAGAHGFIKPPCAKASTARSGLMRCFLQYRPQVAVDQALAAGRQASKPHGYTPADLRSAYKVPTRSTSNQTVAVSIPMHTPDLASFLATYRAEFGLPPCTMASGCLRQVNQQGDATPAEPSAVGSGWDLEATLDVSMISVACPLCKILVVEGKNAGAASLGATEVTAARLGAQVISNSYGTIESAGQRKFEKFWEPRGRTVVASSGDFGFGLPQFPADLASVTAVGGTRLSKVAGSRRGWTETTWPGSSSGCSTRVVKPSWQHDTKCKGRMVADISAVASFVPVFEATYGGWVTVQGTSISAPLLAGMYGLAGNGATVTPAHLYRNAKSFFDVTKGNNAGNGGFTALQDCDNDYICVAKPGYDGPTGLGTPAGLSGL